MGTQEVSASVPDRALVNDAPAGHHPSGFDPSRGDLHLRNGRADRHPQTYGDGVTWCGKKLLGKPDCSVDRVETFVSYGSEVHVTAFDPGVATCQRCREALDAAYSAAFPDGLKPLATIRIDDPNAKELLSPSTMTRFFGPGGEGASAYERFVRSMSSDSDGSPKGGDACGSVHDSAGRETASPSHQVSETPSDTLGEKA